MVEEAKMATRKLGLGMPVAAGPCRDRKARYRAIFSRSQYATPLLSFQELD